MKINSIKEYEVPSTYQFENGLLGCLIDNPEYICEARKRLEDDCFADENNKKLWRVLNDMDTTGKDISMTTVYPVADAQHFQKNILPHCLGTEGVTEIFDKIDALWTASSKRRAYFASTELLKLASGIGSVQQIYDIMHTYVERVNNAVKTDDTIIVGTAVNHYAETLEKRQKDVAAGKCLRVPTSFKNLDFLTYGGFANGNLIILAARPSVGKTGVMLQMARDAALKGLPALVFSLEMTNDELVQRMVTAVSGIEPFALAAGKVDWTAFDKACGRFADAPLWFNDKANKLDDIVAKITSASRQGNCSVAFIDYLGLISYREDGRSLYQQVTDCTKRLKRLAKDCDIPIVLLCQLNRDMCKEEREPKLHDLRDSGSIEQDADIVLMLDRELTDRMDAKLVRMFVRKNRQGQVGDKLVLEADTFFTNFYETD